MSESPYEKIVRRSQEVQQEAIQLAEEVVRALKEPKEALWENNWLGIVERWESIETILGALTLCLQMVREQNPLTIHNLSRQLRRWRRTHGKEQLGWLEVRSVRGHGPYVYYRWRKPGERKIQTEYYGRADALLDELAVMAHRRDDHRDLSE